MNKRIVLWITLIALLIISLPGLMSRWDAEIDNNTYEMAVPYNEIFDLTSRQTVSLDEAFIALKDAGLNSVSLDPISLARLQQQDILTIYNQKELEKALQFTHKPLQYKQQEIGFYITVPENPYYVSKIKEHFKPVELTINEQALYFIPTKKSYQAYNRSLGYDHEIISKVKEHGLNYIMSVENNADSTINTQVTDEIIGLQDDESSTSLLFTGDETIGYPDTETIKNYALQLHDAGYNFYAIESADQKGFQTIARTTNYSTTRLHKMNLTTDRNKDVDRVIRAVKERNIRTVSFHLLAGDPVESLENVTEFLTDVETNMPNQYKSGVPTPFEQINVPLWNKLIVFIASVLFVYLASQISHNRFVEAASVGLTALLIVSYLLFQNIIFLQALALIIAIITPIYAVQATAQASTQISKITWQYLKAVGISLIGIIIILGVLNGNGFISGIEMFRGVKLVYIVPMAYITLFVIMGLQIKFPKIEVINDYLKTPVKYWHFVIIGIIGVLSYYYISRTGNTGMVSNFEVVARQKLEELLYVRPRTKEFLIGLPIYMLALYTMGISKKWGKWLLIPGIIGFLSIVNTFSHLHIPLHISILRTLYGVVLGYLFGLLFIYLFTIGYRYISRVLKKRWT